MDMSRGGMADISDKECFRWRPQRRLTDVMKEDMDMAVVTEEEAKER